MVEVDAVDRLGLLSDFFRVIGELHLEVAHARINTDKGAAQDTFYLTDARDGRSPNAKFCSACARASGRVG